MGVGVRRGGGGEEGGGDLSFPGLQSPATIHCQGCSRYGTSWVRYCTDTYWWYQIYFDEKIIFFLIFIRRLPLSFIHRSVSLVNQLLNQLYQPCDQSFESVDRYPTSAVLFYRSISFDDHSIILINSLINQLNQFVDQSASSFHWLINLINQSSSHLSPSINQLFVSRGGQRGAALPGGWGCPSSHSPAEEPPQGPRHQGAA